MKILKAARRLWGRIRGVHKLLTQIVLLQGTPTTGKPRKMGKDYQKDKNKKRLFLIINATKFASGNNEALLVVSRITGYLGKKLIWIWDIWGEN